MRISPEWGIWKLKSLIHKWSSFKEKSKKIVLIGKIRSLKILTTASISP